MQKIFLLLLVSVGFLSCNKDKDAPDNGNKDKNTHESLNIKPSTAPFGLVAGAVFYGDISYGSHPENVFDIFIPASEQPTGLVIYIHGGGFTSGDKADDYGSQSFQDEVNSYLEDNIAYASINYRLLLANNEQDGVLKPLNDCKRVVQFIKYYRNDFNVDKTEIALLGRTAGAGAALWIGLQNNMAESNADNPVLKESTRVEAIVAINAQATYDIITWPTTVFVEYQDDSFDLDSMLDIVSVQTLFQFYGISDTSELSTPEMLAYRDKVNMLDMFSIDDPDIYLSSEGQSYEIPITKEAVFRHPLHSQMLTVKAALSGVTNEVSIPVMSIDNTGGESIHDFVVRELE